MEDVKVRQGRKQDFRLFQLFVLVLQRLCSHTQLFRTSCLKQPSLKHL